MKLRAVSPCCWEMAKGKAVFQTEQVISNVRAKDTDIYKAGKGDRFTPVENSIVFCTSLVLKSNLRDQGLCV